MNLFELYAVLSLDNKGYKDSLSESQSLTESAGQKIQSVLGKMISLDVLAKAGTALVDMGKSALSSYGDYEQLVGGIETLFDSSADKMLEYAHNAYKTAQISANDYMETATSFSASLLASLGGDTAKATEYANNAIIDMADNANKMGTSMESIQNAYQGFAKQNYTMLDNLKLGYGGTKEEMERLLEDATKLSGVEYDISSFADITSAIRVIQTELGITGTSALEASTTIQGSVNMMKSAWENLLVAMADPNADMTTAFDNLITSVEAVAKNVVPIVQNIVPNLVSSLSNIATTLLPQVTSLISSMLPVVVAGIANLIGSVVAMAPDLIGTITDMIPVLTETLTDMCLQLAETLPEQLPIFIEQLLIAVQAFADSLAENAPILINGAIQLFLGLAEGLTQALPTIIEMIPTIITTLANVINDNMPTILMAGVQLILVLIQGIISAIPTLVENIPQIIEAIVAVWNAVNWLSLGKNLVEGIINGIGSLLGALGTAGANILSAVWNAIKSLPTLLLNLGKSGIKDGLMAGFNAMKSGLLNTAGNLILSAMQKLSSFNLTDIGKNLIQGLINGVGSMGSVLQTAVSSLANSAIDKIKGIFGIHSPSKVMKQIGEYVVEGFNIGVDTFDADSAFDTFNDAIDSLDSVDATINTSGASGGLTQIININKEVATASELARAIRLESQYGLMTGVALG